MSVDTETLTAQAGETATSPRPGLYDRDFARWALREAALIRAGRLSEVDLENVAEEVESLGREQFGKVRGNLRVLLTHMLKWDYQPERRTRSWTLFDPADARPDRDCDRHEPVAEAAKGGGHRGGLSWGAHERRSRN